MPTMSGRERWSLEVVRGREVGRRYQVGIGETPIGNTLAGAARPSTWRTRNRIRRAAWPAVTPASHGRMVRSVIRDLESPGGTFVNRQRLLAGQARPLQPGDLIQLGGVQLEVKRERPLDPQTAVPSQPQPGSQPQPISRPMSAAPAPIRACRVSVPFMIQGGSTCRTWDDFIILAAQRWTLIRDELTSGRIADHLKRIGRSDLVPRPEPTETADEQLDAWLARLPTSRSSDPELDIHPLPLVIRAATPGGLIRKTVRISNVGYRLLRSTVRVEPADEREHPGRGRVLRWPFPDDRPHRHSPGDPASREFLVHNSGHCGRGEQRRHSAD